MLYDGKINKADIVIKYNKFHILHNIKDLRFLQNFDDYFDVQLVENKIISARLRGENELAKYSDFELYFKRQWEDFPDHKLLTCMLESGLVPKDLDVDSLRIGKPSSCGEMQKRSEMHGYSAPYEGEISKSISISEYNAFYAATSLFANNDKSLDWLFNCEFSKVMRWREKVCQITSQFVVPSLFDNQKWPYLLDQLWIVRMPGDNIRLIGLEIDGEEHLRPKEIKKMIRRDAELNSMGYEMYHVAGWWCRVDPFRAIAEFLSCAGIDSSVLENLRINNKQNVSDYLCDYCGQKMARHEPEDIFECNSRYDTKCYHNACHQYMLEDGFSDVQECED